MPLNPGEKLGPYEILTLVGAGGMGEVYRARDTRLDRTVAIKISRENFTERFDREARVVASLNDPNIRQLYDVGPNYLVMEYVEGQTLAERLSTGPLPLEMALDYARQIATALEAAHDKGIVHRDLKPGNIKITPEGVVKVLDFGLANVASFGSGAVTENSPTLTLAATQMGVILGTAAYMAPEQARGMKVDKRADIWAFGVVLYEMVTGKRLFEGQDLTDTLAAVVREKPDLSVAPAELRRVLERCLEKDPKKRLRDISGVALLLEQGASAPPPAAPVRTARWPWAIAAAAALGLSALAFVHFRETPPELRSVQFPMEAPPDAGFTNEYGGYAASPDGRYVIFTAQARGTRSLWLRPLDSITARPLPGTENGNFPTWSPDSRSLAFYAEGKLKRIELSGGAPLTLCDAANERVSPTGTWSRDGVILFGGAAGLRRVSASGGGAALLTKVDSAGKESGHGYPQFLPDGNRFLYFVASDDSNVQGVYASSLTNPSQRRQILRVAAKAVYVPPRAVYPGYLLWLQQQTLLAQRFDAGSLQLEGSPVSVAEEIGLNPGSSIRAAFWASDAGLLIYFSRLAAKAPVVWVRRDGQQLGEAAPADSFFTVALAPGAGRMAVDREDATSGSGNRDIWVRDFARGVMTRLTFDPTAERLPIWSPDGRQVAFASDRTGGVFQIYRMDAAGAGQEQRLTEGPTSKQPLDWSHDGRYILYREENAKTRHFDLMAVPVDGDREPIPVVRTQFEEATGAVSPDGRWVAYASNDSGQFQLYMQAFPGVAGAPKGRWQISNGSAYEVKWRGDGKELYYETLDGKMMAVAVQAGPQGVRPETPRVLFSAPFRTGAVHEFDVTPNGERFLILLLPSAQDDRLTVVSNWQAALRK